MNLIHSSDISIAVTGATGWVGRTFLDSLQKSIPASLFNSKVLAFGSKAACIQSSAYPKGEEIYIPVLPLDRLPDLVANKSIYLIHSAFLTKDRLSAYGYNNFVSINQSITRSVCEAISRSSSARVVEISSGAALAAYERDEQSLDSSQDPYGYLKLQEESSISQLAETQVFRIFALSGRFIRDPKAFALGDFLLSALRGKPIEIKARSPVIRGYVNASDVAACALSWISSNEPPVFPIAAINEITCLTSLARQISLIYGISSPICPILQGSSSAYSYSPARFTAMCRAYAISPMILYSQILDTATGLLNCL